MGVSYERGTPVRGKKSRSRLAAPGQPFAPLAPSLFRSHQTTKLGAHDSPAARIAARQLLKSHINPEGKWLQCPANMAPTCAESPDSSAPRVPPALEHRYSGT